MSSLEAAVCMPFGRDVSPRGLPTLEAPDALTVLEDALVPALERPPCLVTFSGGHDSSAVLAAAVRAARRKGLAPPVAITLRFPRAPRAEESERQERVIRHLEVADWIRVEIGDELDFVGPIARDLLVRQGPYFPPNSHLLVPMLERARSGSLAVGLGGDQLLGGWRWARLGALLARRVRPTPRDALHAALALAPGWLRRRVFARRAELAGLPWLRPEAGHAVRTLEARSDAAMPARWDRFVADASSRRTVTLGARSLASIGADFEVVVTAPLLDPRFVVALARAGGRLGLGDRSQAMRAVFGRALPPDLLARRDKAGFSEVFWTHYARRFAETWSGRGLDHAVVDAEAVHQAWLEQPPDYRSSMLLQAAWLHENGRSGEGKPTHRDGRSTVG